MNPYRDNARPPGRPCPDCSAEMETRHAGALSVETCGKCGGVWMKASDFNRVRVETGDLSAMARMVPGGPSPAEARYRRCPVCDRPMVRQNFKRTSGVLLDACRKHGVWFDRGELEDLARYLQTPAVERIPRVPAPGPSPPDPVADFLEFIGEKIQAERWWERLFRWW